MTSTRCSSIPSADDLGLPEGLDSTNDCVEVFAAPVGDDRSLTRPNPDGVLREEIDDDLQISRITNVEQRCSSFDHAFAAAHDLQHDAAYRGGHRHAFAVFTQAPDLLPRQEA